MKYKEILEIKKGDILNNQWGYDMIINDYCKVLKNSGKTIKCQKISKKVVQGDIQQGRVVPDSSKTIGNPFNIKISKSKPNINDPLGEAGFLVGSYPLGDGESRSKIKGHWSKWDGLPDVEDHMD